MLRWDMPMDTSATWAFGVHGRRGATTLRGLDEHGYVTRTVLADGRTVTSLMNGTPFTWSGAGIEFAGTVGVVITTDGKHTATAIRADKLTAR